MIFSQEIRQWIGNTTYDSGYQPICDRLWYMRVDEDRDYPAHDFAIEGDSLTCIMKGKEKPQPVKIGKMVTLLTGDRFDSTMIESFVTAFKAHFFMDESCYEVKILTGEDVLAGYTTANYYNKGAFSLAGGLANSCMNNDLHLLDVYVKNPDSIALACLYYTDTEGTAGIVARALQWKAKSSGYSDADYLVLDRIYANQPCHKSFMERWGKQNGMILRQTGTTFLTPSLNEAQKIYMRVALSETGMEKFPYIDTFRYINLSDGIAYNSSESECICCDQTDGSVSNDTRTPEDHVWSSHHNQWIHADDAVYCDSWGDYIREEDSVMIDDEYYHEDDDKIIYAVTRISRYSNREWMLKEDCFEDVHGNWYSDELRYEFALSHDDDEWYLIDSLDSDNNGEWFTVGGEDKVWHEGELLDELPKEEPEEDEDESDEPDPSKGVDVLGNEFTLGDEDYRLVTLDDGSITGQPVWMHWTTLAIAPEGRYKIISTNQLTLC